MIHFVGNNVDKEPPCRGQPWQGSFLPGTNLTRNRLVCDNIDKDRVVGDNIVSQRPNLPMSRTRAR